MILRLGGFLAARLELVEQRLDSQALDAVDGEDLGRRFGFFDGADIAGRGRGFFLDAVGDGAMMGDRTRRRKQGAVGGIASGFLLFARKSRFRRHGHGEAENQQQGQRTQADHRRYRNPRRYDRINMALQKRLGYSVKLRTEAFLRRLGCNLCTPERQSRLAKAGALG